MAQNGSSNHQVSEFLKNCRARIQPSDLGLPDPQRRRTPGLRREDVAALSGLSVTWYTWLEQGRKVHVSDAVLERLSSTFRLTEDERGYLYSLVQHRAAPLLAGDADHVASPDVLHMLHTLPIPALVKTARWDVIGWNDLVRRVFRDYSAMAPSERNLLRILFTDPSYAVDPAEFRAMARRVLAKVRVDYSQAGSDPAFDELIAELEERSPMFKAVWRSPEVNGRSEGLNLVRHPTYGELRFEHTSYVPEGHSLHRVVIFVPHDEHTSRHIAAIHAELMAPVTTIACPQKKART
ncbi:MAG: helix-turn-helix domain-containing protein [Gammaproteobacteria bacterium]|nr:helix-turn-helix domain-containing protein [Gammaproteobacteria bacterium]